jgi:plastocyanin
LTGTPPENPAIRLRSDPMCDQANGGRPATRETVIAGADGSLANVFVQLQGSFPAMPVPTEPVVIDQRACNYSPHVVGARLGQIVRVRNSDPGLHNVHGISGTSDTFNVSQPMAGMTNDFRMKTEGIVRLQCDVHGWMLAFVGVSSHPYFAVTGAPGAFEIRDVPVGSYTIQAWHELYGPLTLNVRVEAGRVADVDFVYSADEKRAP